MGVVGNQNFYFPPGMWSTPSFAHDSTAFAPRFTTDAADWEGFSSAFPLPPQQATKNLAPNSATSARSYVGQSEHFTPSFFEGQWTVSESKGAETVQGIPPFGLGSGQQGAAEKSTPKIEEEISNQNLYKTELCRSFEETGTCRYGPKCQFAHGKAELRPVLRHPKYKTQICKTFYSRGTCPYGRRCRFIHSVPGSNDQTSNPSSPSSAGMRKNPAPSGVRTPTAPASPAGEHVPFSTMHSFSPSPSVYGQVNGEAFGSMPPKASFGVQTPPPRESTPNHSFYQAHAPGASFSPWNTKSGGAFGAGNWGQVNPTSSMAQQASEPFQLITPNSSTPYSSATANERDRLAFFERI